jgi:hypothetical protein
VDDDLAMREGAQVPGDVCVLDAGDAAGEARRRPDAEAIDADVVGKVERELR